LCRRHADEDWIIFFNNEPQWAESAPIFADTILINPRLLATVYKLVGSEERKVPLLTKKGI